VVEPAKSLEKARIKAQKEEVTRTLDGAADGAVLVLEDVVLLVRGPDPDRAARVCAAREGGERQARAWCKAEIRGKTSNWRTSGAHVIAGRSVRRHGAVLGVLVVRVGFGRVLGTEERGGEMCGG
jgi:hypothetical protein